jgi:membrane-bound metal-dependent hydrolase YbcI (DUF457 family)
MPFTPSHVAAALPFRRTRLIMSALVIGCIVPDTPFFLFLMAHGFHGHTLVGIFDFDLPMGLVELWLYHAFIRQPLLLFLPTGVRQRIGNGAGRFSFLPLSRFAWIVLSMLVGIATHLLWDSTCHMGTWPYRHWEFLRSRVHLPVIGVIAGYKLLEYLNSLFGIAVVAVWVWFWYRTTQPSASRPVEPLNGTQKRVVAATLLTVAIVGGGIRAFLKVGVPAHLRPFVLFSAYALVTAIALLLVGLLVVGIILRRQSPARGGLAETNAPGWREN